MYLNPRVHGSIPTKGKNLTSEGGEEYREVAVQWPPKVVGPGLLQNNLGEIHYTFKCIRIGKLANHICTVYTHYLKCLWHVFLYFSYLVFD
jgi:hypothetical protein